MAFKVGVGKSDFEEIRKSDDYYVDKTDIMYELVEETDNKVTLFTRPRRFGKTLIDEYDVPLAGASEKDTADHTYYSSMLDVTEKFETLLNGGTITQSISDELTYDILHVSEDNLWSVLLISGFFKILKKIRYKNAVLDENPTARYGRWDGKSETLKQHALT